MKTYYLKAEKEMLIDRIEHSQIDNKNMNSNKKNKSLIKKNNPKRKKKISIKKSTLFFKSIICSLLKYYFSIILIISISTNINNDKGRKLQLSFSEINMEVIAIIGEQRVIGSEFNQCPDEIYLN